MKVDVLAFRAASEVLPRISDDDCNVILQDWDETNPDQQVAMRLAAELLNTRAAVVELLEVANVVRQFLRSNKWGTIDYMEGSEVYNDLDDLAKVVDGAIAGAKP